MSMLTSRDLTSETQSLGILRIASGNAQEIADSNLLGKGSISPAADQKSSTAVRSHIGVTVRPSYLSQVVASVGPAYRELP